jgi:hypothetical protein
MISLNDIIESIEKKSRKPDENELRKLPDRIAVVHGRLSDTQQVRDSRESVREIAVQLGRAIEDGYKTNLDPAMVEGWLEKIRTQVIKPDILRDGQVIVNCLGLGVSGSLPEEKRPDLVLDIELLEKKQLGAIYVTEGANRLSRDPDRLVSAKLLKLMKDSNCKLRTSYEILSPCIERDWEIIHQEFERGAEELKQLNKRLFHRKELRANRGEFVGEPIPPGFILPITGRKANGEYLFGKMQPYPPHAAIDVRVLQEFIRCRGSKLKTALALAEVTFPSFPPDLVYMERYSALRNCPATPAGYRITPATVKGLVTNLKLIGVWRWGDTIRVNNHEPVVPESLFLTAYELALARAKPKGRAIYYEPMEWSGILWCCKHEKPAILSSYSSGGVYRCKRDYEVARGRICLNIEKRFIDEPLTTAVLRQLDFTPFVEEVLERLEIEAEQEKLVTSQNRHEIDELERRLESLKQYLGCGDKQREEIYWQQYQSTEKRLKELLNNPVTERTMADVDINMVRQFLVDLPNKWRNYSSTVRNRLLKLIIAKVEIRHDANAIEATVYWKTGFHQQVIIQRAKAVFNQDSIWSDEEDKLLETLWPDASTETLLKSFPKRTWSAVRNHAQHLGLKRMKKPESSMMRHHWTKQEETQARALYEKGTPVSEIALKLHQAAIEQHAKAGKWNRPSWFKQRKKPVIWKIAEQNFKGFQEESSQYFSPSQTSNIMSVTHI